LREGDGAVRWSNQRSWEKYLGEVEAGRLPSATVERLDAATLRAERVAMGLRLTNGVELPSTPRVEQLIANGLAVRDGPRLKLTERGLDVHSAIAAQLI